ncbi:MAG: FtsX-like permease family protein [Anaerolineaceae bacterium]|nr:FtsX-like permease family protein [Anaerolineaceae bacterium]
MQAIILKNLLRRKGRTILTVLGISLGVAAIIGLGAMASGLETGYSSMLAGSKADLVISQPDTFDISFSSVDDRLGDELLKIPEVAAVSAMIQGFVQTEGSPYFFVFGYPKDSFVLNRFQIVEGVSLFDRQAQRMRGKPVMLGSAAAETLDKKAGDSMRFGGSAYRVVGIYQTGDAFEDSGAVFNLPDAQELLGKPRQVSLFYIQLKDPNVRERLIARAERLWPNLELSTTAELDNKQMMGDVLKGYAWVIAGLAIVLGGIGMMNAQLMSVYERTREIGVLRAVGWDRKRVLFMILGESLIVCLAGGLIGIALGWLFLVWVTSTAVVFGATAANLSADLIVQAVVIVLVLGLVGGLYPAYRATRLQPVEALRYEGGSGGGRAHRLPIGGLALQSLWQRRTRTLLTVSVIAITVGAIMSLEAMVRGMTSQMTDLTRGMGAEVMVRQADIADTSFSAVDERIGSQIAAMPEVAYVSGMLMTAVMLPESGSFFLIQGYAPNEYAIRHLKLEAGKLIKSNREIMIGHTIAEVMNKKVGDTIDLSGSRFRVVGIYTSSISWEELGGVITLRSAQSFMGRPRKVTMYGVRLHDPSQAKAVVEKLNQNPAIHASLSGEFMEQLPDMEASDAMMGGISVLAIAVGGLGVMNTMLMAVFERTREIGVLRAVGWRRRAVLGMILRESLMLAFIGGLSGILVAFLLSFLMVSAPMIGEMLTPIFEWDVFVRAILVALLLGIVGGLYPAYRATLLQPVEALRYE